MYTRDHPHRNHWQEVEDAFSLLPEMVVNGLTPQRGTGKTFDDFKVGDQVAVFKNYVWKTGKVHFKAKRKSTLAIKLYDFGNLIHSNIQPKWVLHLHQAAPYIEASSS